MEDPALLAELQAKAAAAGALCQDFASIDLYLRQVIRGPGSTVGL